VIELIVQGPVAVLAVFFDLVVSGFFSVSELEYRLGCVVKRRVPSRNVVFRRVPS
jgi:hypothetical protein